MKYTSARKPPCAARLTMAYTDPVTRLPNRLRFMSKLDATVARDRPFHS
jgi:GGDEF domain-containing protein